MARPASSWVTWLLQGWECMDWLVQESQAEETRPGYNQDCTHSHSQRTGRTLLLLGSYHFPLLATRHWRRLEWLPAAMGSSGGTFLQQDWLLPQRTDLYRLKNKQLIYHILLIKTYNTTSPYFYYNKHNLLISNNLLPPGIPAPMLDGISIPYLHFSASSSRSKQPVPILAS